MDSLKEYLCGPAACCVARSGMRRRERRRLDARAHAVHYVGSEPTRGPPERWSTIPRVRRLRALRCGSIRGTGETGRSREARRTITPPPNIVPGPSPTPILTTTTDAHGHFTISAPNGTYLLVIGSDDNTDTTRPTIHDKALLYGQSVLAAPTMPPIPGITPAPVETSGNYRLVTIDQVHELPCINDYDQQRTQRGLPKPVIDEWLTENVRAAGSAVYYAVHCKQVDPKNPFGFLTIGSGE